MKPHFLLFFNFTQELLLLLLPSFFSSSYSSSFFTSSFFFFQYNHMGFALLHQPIPGFSSLTS
jgi:hypothetical protein